MLKVETISETKHYIQCLWCDKGRFSIGHLFGKPTTWGTWYCDNCGGGCKGSINSNNEIYAEKVDQRRDYCNVFLRNGNILLIVKGMYFDGDLDLNSSRYIYEQHTCPTNYLKEVEVIVDLKNNNTDPHGIFKFIGAVPYVDMQDMDFDEIISNVKNFGNVVGRIN